MTQLSNDSAMRLIEAVARPTPPVPPVRMTFDAWIERLRKGYIFKPSDADSLYTLADGHRILGTHLGFVHPDNDNEFRPIGDHYHGLTFRFAKCLRKDVYNRHMADLVANNL